MTEIRALSLTQPWATLLAIGAKGIETRSWSHRYRGWIAIHAAKGFPNKAKRLCWQEPFESVLAGAGYKLNQRLQDYGKNSFPLGAIIAVGILHRINRIGRSPDGRVCLRQTERFVEGDELLFGDYTPGRCGWVFTNVGLLPEPIPCKGMLGLWTPPPDIQARLEAHLG